MADWTLRLYHQLPPFMRSWVASLRGYYLKSWRYGPGFDELVEDILSRDSWSAQQWTQYQTRSLEETLHRAATQVPYYRDLWSKRRANGDKASWSYLENWPILDKELVRANPTAFIADDCQTSQMYHEHTSGTTGKSLDLWWSKQTVQQWYAYLEARWRRWYGVSCHDRWAILGGQLVAPADSRRPPFWVWNAGLNQLYMSSYHLAPDLISHYLDALHGRRIRYLWGYTSSLYELALGVLKSGRQDLQMAVVITNAEPVFDYQREAIEEAFQCPLRETYGMAEIVMAAGECEAGNLHLWPEVGVVEVAHGDQIIDAGVTGDFIATGTLNRDMPLIRYRIGDQGALSTENHCSCGRHMPLLDSIEGRVDDMLYTLDGRRIGRLDPIFKAKLPVIEAQIIQEQLDRVRVRYVPAADFTEDAARSIEARLRDRMGDVSVILESVDRIPRTANGKFRAVICEIPDQERPRPIP